MAFVRTVAPLWALAFLASGYASAQAVWQIGRFDQSPGEFTHRAAPALTYTVGSSDPKRDWPARQSTGSTYRIVFDLQQIRPYTLHIVALIDRPRVPTLSINVNGKKGSFFLHPKLSYSRSDDSFSFDPHESQSTVQAQIPAQLLKQGSNTIAITTVDSPPTASGDEEIGGFNYDALELTPSAPTTSARNKVALEPTIFFQQTSDGLAEIVDGFFTFDGPWQAQMVDLSVQGKHYRTQIPAGDFGESRVSFPVAAWDGTVPAKIAAPGIANSSEISLIAQRKWTVFVVPHTHLDIGYSDYQGKVAEIQSRVLARAQSLIHENPDFRFSPDGSWNVEQYLATRSEAKIADLMDLFKSGKMSLPAQYVNVLTGYASLETLYRSLYTSRDLSRKYNLPFEYANITDVPTYSGSYPSILASSGVKYWVGASNNDRAPVLFYNHWNEKSPFWWVGPDGKKVLFWYSRHYQQVQTLFGLPPQQLAIRESLPIYMQAFSTPTYKPDVALVYGVQVENTDLYPATATFATEWNKNYAYPKLQYSTFSDFFHYVEQHYSKDLPEFKGDGGGYWEDGIGSDAYFAAEDRANQNRALSAEVLSTVTHTLDPNLGPPTNAFTDIWRNIVLFSEHTWLSYNSVSQPNQDESIRQLRVKDNRAEQAALQIADVTDRSMSQLADQIHIPANTLVVFNSLNWKRDLMVETDLDENSGIVDLSTQKPIVLQVLSHQQRFKRVRFVSPDTPPVGYKCFSITRHQQPVTTPQLDKSQTVESDFYRITIDEKTGSLNSIFDKQLGRELVDMASPYKFGEYLYVTGGDGVTQMMHPFPALPPGRLTINNAANGKLLGVEQTSWGKSIRLASTNVNTPQVETEVLLFDHQKKIEFRIAVSKDYTERKEGVYIAFPVAAQNPQFAYASQQGSVDPSRDLMKGGSLEWFNVQQWMAVSDAGTSVGIVPVDASLASFGDINRGQWPGDFQPKSSTLFSYVMNNYWHTNYRAGQGGTFVFRYVMTSANALNGGALTRLGLDAMRSAEINEVVGQDKTGNPPRPLPAEGRSFLQIQGDGIALSTWKLAEDHRGTILRLMETDGKNTEGVIHLPSAQVTAASLCSGVEDDLQPLATSGDQVTVSLKPFEVVTLRVVNAADAKGQ